MSVRLEHGDCLAVMRDLLAEGVRVDAVVTDPPYGLGFMGKAWDSPETVAFRAETWGLALQLLKPGGHMVAFSGTRTYHRMACAIEDAGFEIRDQLAWCYGSGFPKSHDVSKAIDRHNGDERPVVGARKVIPGVAFTQSSPYLTGASELAVTSAASAAWEGWGTALKPAWEPIVLARKPLIGTVAANVLAHGTGGLNIDGCRVGTGEDKGVWPITELRHDDKCWTLGATETDATKGRFPANLIHDGSPEVLAGFPETASGGYPPEGGERTHGATYGKPNARGEQAFTTSQGSAARFFYSAKADASDRLGSKHPTVKPVDLMAWLCRLVTPPGGLILDPFAGSGTTGMAAMREGFRAILIEREAEYVADIKRRVAHVKGEDAPLFGGLEAPPPQRPCHLRRVRGRTIGPTGLRR